MLKQASAYKFLAGSETWALSANAGESGGKTWEFCHFRILPSHFATGLDVIPSPLFFATPKLNNHLNTCTIRLRLKVQLASVLADNCIFPCFKFLNLFNSRNSQS